MVFGSHVGFRVEGVTEASLTSDVFVACLFQHSCRGLAGLSPSASSQASRAATVEPAKNQGCVSGLETWEWGGEGGALRLDSLGEFATSHDACRESSLFFFSDQLRVLLRPS